MFKQIIKIIRRLEFVSYFILPIIFVLILNFDWGYNIFKLLIHINEPHYLFCIRTNNNALTLLALQLTLFIIFFTFVQFSLSKQELPTDLIRKYIIESQTTMNFLGSQLSIAFILAFYSIFNSIYEYQNILCIILILCSVLVLIGYFYWLIYNIQGDYLFETIINKIKLTDIIKFQDNLKTKRQSFHSSLVKENFFKYTYDDPFHGQSVPSFVDVRTNQRGFLCKIDIAKINEILNEYVDDIEQLIIVKQIGDYCNKNSYITQYSTESQLIRIQLKSIKISEAVKWRVYDKIGEIFEIVEPTDVLNNYYYLEDLLKIIFYRSFDISEIEKISKSIDEFFEREVFSLVKKNTKKDNYAITFVYIFINLLNNIITNLMGRKLDYNLIYKLLTNFSKFAQATKSIDISYTINDVLLNINSVNIISTKLNDRILFNPTIHLCELQLFPIWAYGNVSDINENWNNFYSKVIVSVIKGNVANLKSILDNFHRLTPELRLKYINSFLEGIDLLLQYIQHIQRKVIYFPNNTEFANEILYKNTLLVYTSTIYSLIVIFRLSKHNSNYLHTIVKEIFLYLSKREISTTSNNVSNFIMTIMFYLYYPNYKIITECTDLELFDYEIETFGLDEFWLIFSYLVYKNNSTIFPQKIDSLDKYFINILSFNKIEVNTVNKRFSAFILNCKYDSLVKMFDWSEDNFIEFKNKFLRTFDI